MPDICDLVLDDHHTFRRRFAELDELRAAGADSDPLGKLWETLATLLELHASAEEELLYPHLLRRGENAEEETRDAISDHNEIRDAIRRASSAAVGTQEWWDEVLAAREANSTHMGEEEREALPDYRTNAAKDTREELGARWLEFTAEHGGGRAIDTTDKDPDAFISGQR